MKAIFLEKCDTVRTFLWTVRVSTDFLIAIYDLSTLQIDNQTTEREREREPNVLRTKKS